ncbi:hypothetical protein [Halobacillus amylolyticus]|uniref:Uncharacterized protein n=1 Tax=Halobacillus amylolyticus TaxID=2932259 RepID=A0ABY4HD58_9BACI|nr:hypothetical protein [Halobacillus amylolyticus]UOR12836.1 hypothetical protein MUO15_04800 [Halobacillus amylolyticus]
MNKKMGLLGLFGLLLFLSGITLSQWTPFAILIGIGGGIVMGYSSLKLFSY